MIKQRNVARDPFHIDPKTPFKISKKKIFRFVCFQTHDIIIKNMHEKAIKNHSDIFKRPDAYINRMFENLKNCTR